MNKRPSPSSKPVLIGNSFPLPLIRRAVTIRPWPLRRLKTLLASRPVVSFWGHENTRSAGESILGVSLAPAAERPALALSPDRLPALDGASFSSCYVLSPDYRPGFRPAPGVEVPPRQISGWSLLRIDWLPAPSRPARSTPPTTPNPERESRR